MPKPLKRNTVTEGSVFATFISEGIAMTQELEARRRFGNDVGEFLRKKGLVDEFETFRNAKKTKS